jgi:hypothetical protein
MFLLFDEKIIRSCHIIPGIIDQKVIAALLRHDRVQGEFTSGTSSTTGTTGTVGSDLKVTLNVKPLNFELP